METVRQVHDLEELCQLIRAGLGQFGVPLTPAMIHVEPYTYDARIDWDTYLITIDGYGVWGMSNGPL
jgi:hypothetical protein